MNDNIAEKEDYLLIDVKSIIKNLFKSFWLILLVASICGIGFFLKSYFTTVPMYSSTARVYTISADKGGNSVYEDIMLSEELINDYEEIIKSRYVMETVVKEMKLQYDASLLKEAVSVQAIEGTRIIEISVEDTDPLMARDLTNKVCEVAGERIVDVMNIEAINIIDEARIPESPYNNNVIADSIKGFILGAIIVCVIVVIVSIFDTSIKNEEDVLRMTGITALGAIPYDEEEGKKGFGKSKNFRNNKLSSSKKTF